MAIHINTLNGGNITIGAGGSSGHPETRFTLQGGTVETANITGTLDRQWMHNNGYYNIGIGKWLKTITQTDIGNTVTNIGDETFNGCSSLTSVTIPDSVESIGSGAFDSCTALTSVTISNNMESIGIGAFSGCSGLASVTVPDSMTSIGNYAFDSCSSLTSVTIVATGKPGASAASVKQAMIDAGVSSSITWNMPS